MMELTCAFIIIIASSVCASPYGYGTKGGAVAKAEASATAGNSDGLSGLPYSVPNGAGYSGSFSKSSSSSFASSSASSSSSSSSFSFSGTGASALHGSGANGGTGCVSGGCLSGAHGITDNHGSGATGISKAYSGANAAATNGITGTHGTGASGSGQAYSGANAAATHGITGTHGTGDFGTNQAYNGANSAAINGITGTHGAGGSNINQAYSGANAGAAAAAVNLGSSYGFSNKEGNAACTGSTGSQCSNAPSGCVGSSCTHIDTSSKCRSGHCGPPGSSTSHINSDTKCTSGQCGVNTAETGSLSSNSHDSNDIPAKFATSSPNSKEQHSNYDKTSTLDESISGPGCSYGNCGSLVTTNLKPTEIQGPASPNQSPNFNHSPKCDSPDCNSYNYNANSNAIGSAPIVGYHKPATYLTTPKQGSSCTTSECQKIPNIDSEKPSSYNVPIHPSYEHTEVRKPTCNGGICDYQQQKSPNTVTGTSTLPLNIPTGPSGSELNCAFGKCPGHAPTHSNADFDGPKFPPYPQGSLSPIGPTHKLPTAPSFSTCSTPNCAPTTYSGSEADKHVAVPSVGSVTYPHTNPSYITPEFGHQSHKVPSAGNHYSNCNTPNCAGYSSEISPSAKPELSSVYPSGGHLTSGLKNPSITSSGLPSYNAPNFQVTIPSCNSPNCAGNPSLNAGSPIDHSLQTPIHSVSPHIPSVSGIFSSPSKYPSQSSSGSPTHHIPNAGSTSPSCKTPNCAEYSPVNAGPASHTEQKLPAYTGGFGGPAGFLQPNEFNTNHFSGAGSTSHVGTEGIVKPITGLNPSDQKLPTYSSGFGGPSGLLQPNEFNTGTHSGNAGATAGSASGIIDNARPSYGVGSTDQKQPSYTGSFGAPSGLLKPHELSPSHSSSNADVAVASNAGSASFVKPSTAQTGHYGTPSGLPKPIEFNAGHPTSSSTAPGSESLITGFGKPISSTSFDQEHPSYTSDHNAPSGIQKPDFSPNHPATVASIPTITHTGSVHVINPSAGASSYDEKVPPYSGGFGGAPGILKPDEFKITTSNINKNPTPVSTYNPISCSSGNCGTQTGHLTPAHMHGSGLSGTESAVANAAAVANAEAIAYSGGFGGPPGLLKPYDGGKVHKGSLATGGKLFLGSQFGLHHGSASEGAGTPGSEIGTTGVAITNTGAGVHAPHSSNNINEHSSGSQADVASKAIATAQASAVAQASATASSGAFSGSIGAYDGQADIHGNKHAGGCGGGCGSNGGDPNLSKGLGWSKTGIFDNLSAAGASAKSTAGAVSGARALGIGGGNFASSSASAHASSGYPTKGGYGR